jgi:DNA-binding NarL/FixJ family response regulator
VVVRPLPSASTLSAADGWDAPDVAPLEVLVADGSALTRAGVRHVLELNECHVCAEAADAASAVEAARFERPEVCLLDTELPGGALEAAKAIAANVAGSSIVMFATSLNGVDLFSALQAGASGYLSKDTEPSQLAVALRLAAQGDVVVPRTLVATMIEELHKRDRQRQLPCLRELTGRELEVLELLAQGHKTAEIASRLFVSHGTIRTHVASILRKVGVSDRAAAISLLNDH